MPAEPATDHVRSVRRFADCDHQNVVSWHGYTVGGHHAARQAPDVLFADLRGFLELLAGDR